MSLDVVTATAREIAAAVSAGEVSAQQVVGTARAHIASVDPKLNAFTDLTGDRARASAEHIDQGRPAGRPLGPLAGVPFAVKNIYYVAGVVTRAGSKIN